MFGSDHESFENDIRMKKEKSCMYVSKRDLSNWIKAIDVINSFRWQRAKHYPKTVLFPGLIANKVSFLRLQLNFLVPDTRNEEKEDDNDNDQDNRIIIRI